MAEHQAHATTGTYLRIAAILVMITLVEVGVFMTRIAAIRR